MVEVIGEPNCSWPEFNYFYFELESGLFAVCKVEGVNSQIRPRVNGRVVRPDVVVALYLADERKNLETIWMATDIVKVLGEYYYFSPAKIKLTEGFFKTFSSRSSTMSQLQEEIGLPHIDGTGYCYYHLDGNRFVECRYLDDNLQSFFVVDSEKRLYSLGKQRGQKKNC